MTRTLTADPTYDELMAFLRTQQLDGPDEHGADFDRAAAIYWFGNFYHGGGGSNLYSAMCQTGFRPGGSANGPEPESSEEDLYRALVREYAPWAEEIAEWDAVDEADYLTA